MNQGTVFYKMTGSGNDFVMLDGRYVAVAELDPATVAAICDRRRGIGADGVALLVPSSEPGIHFAFHFWNRDGSPGPMCGNGALCATRLAAFLELAPADGDIRFSTSSGTHQGRVFGQDDQAEIALPDCQTPKPLPRTKTVAGEEAPVLVHPSVPHLVLRVKNVEKVAIEARGPSLRRDPALGKGGANVNWLSPRGDGSWRMRTFERGVEGETLACGTGAVACALALGAGNEASSPVRIWTTSGMPLDVCWEKAPVGATQIRLRGEARLIYRAILGSLLSQAPTTD
jgi:diaminopimelate epimerase